MDRITSLISSVREKKLLSFAVLIILLIAIPITMYLVKTQKIFKGRAHEVNISHIDFPELSGTPPTTTSQNVRLKLTYGTGSAPSPTPPTATAYRVFVTSQTYTGDLKTAGGGTDGLNGADRICQNLATTASLGGTWKAWLSIPGVNAKDRLGSYNGVYKLVNGTTVVNSQAELLGGSLQTPIKQDENGRDISAEPNQAVWTNTQTTGLSLPSTTTTPGFWEGVPQATFNGTACQSWTLAQFVPILKLTGGIGGANQRTGGVWTQFGRVSDSLDGRAFDCNNQARLYCFEVGSGTGAAAADVRSTPTLTPTRAPGSVVCTGGIECDSQCFPSGTTCGPSSGSKTCYYTSGSNNCYRSGAPSQSCQYKACSAAATATPRPTSAPTAAPTAASVVCAVNNSGCVPTDTSGQFKCCTRLTCTATPGTSTGYLCK